MADQEVIDCLFRVYENLFIPVGKSRNIGEILHQSRDRKSDNIFAVQNEVSLLIAEKLREHYGHFEIQEHLGRTIGPPSQPAFLAIE